MPVQSRHMMTILYFFTILIMISGSFYPAFALDTSQTCDTIILPPHWPSSHIYITDTNESSPYIPLTDHTTIFHDDDVWNTSTQPRDVHVTLTIQDQDTGQQVFNQTQSLQMKACSGPESVKWRFVPTQIADYHANLSDNRGTVGMIFYSMLDATKSQTVSSPLEQLRFGIDSHNVVCKQDLQLVIKSEDGFPACVTKQTAQILVERGWGTIIGSATHQASENTVVRFPSNEKLPSCASHIKNQETFGGYAGALSCPVTPFYISSKIVNYTGFYGVYDTMNASSVVGPGTYTNTEQEGI